GIASTLEQSLIAAGRVFEVLDAPLDVESPAVPERLPAGGPRGAVRFEGVEFAYHAGEPEASRARGRALAGIELDVEPGQTVALFGATGAGKSTLLGLIPRFYDPSHGRVLVDGVDVRR